MTHAEESRLREEIQVEALRAVADLGTQRAELLRRADELLEPIREAALRAARAGAPRRRTQELSHVSAQTYYRWLDEAGIDVRPKKGSRRRGSPEQRKSP